MFKPIDEFLDPDHTLHKIIHPNIVPEPVFKINITPTEITFPTTPINTLSEPLKVIIKNIGNQNLLIEGIELVGSFIIFPNVPTILKPNKTSYINVISAPKNVSNSSGGIYINSNTINSVEFVKLFGQGSN